MNKKLLFRLSFVCTYHEMQNYFLDLQNLNIRNFPRNKFTKV